MTSELALEWTMLGVNIVFLGANVYAAETYWRRRELRTPVPMMRELAKALYTGTRLYAAALIAVRRLEELLEAAAGDVPLPLTHVYLEVRRVVRELRDVLAENRPS